MKLRYHLSDIDAAAGEFWRLYPLQTVFGFQGDLGAGKTTFIHALCTAKGVTSRVGSPTFSIINEYVYPAGKIFHIDLYRLKDEAEAVRAGVEDVLYSGSICLVEWPDRAPGIFPDHQVCVRIGTVDAQTREITGGES